METTDRSVGTWILMRREDILSAAAQMFREKGYNAASMQDIADTVGLQKASLYYHVSGKQEILLAILDHALDLLNADMEQVVQKDLPPEEKLREAMRAYTHRLTSDADLAAVLLLEHRSLKPALRKKHIIRRDKFEGYWRQIVVEGVDQGIFRPVDPGIIGFALLGVQNWMITWYRGEGKLTPDELADRFWDLFFYGLQSDHRAAK